MLGGDGWTYRCEYVCCGRCCTRCAHGPYWYRYRRHRSKLKKEYCGKTDPRSQRNGTGGAQVDPRLHLWDLMLRKESACESVALKCLGIEVAVSRGQVCKAYRAQMLLHHPDRGGSVVASEAINAAWSYLKAWYRW